MVNLVIDAGNTRIKVGWFEQNELKETSSVSSWQELSPWLNKPHHNIIVSSVATEPLEVFDLSSAKGIKIRLSNSTPVPVQIKYATPETLGVDRLAAVCGAYQLFAGEDCLIIDAGTCINYEWLDASGFYWGGIISPGCEMRFKAMHTFTARLPLFEAAKEVQLIGNSTQSCMQSGVMNGIMYEMEGIIHDMQRKCPRLRVILCGGDAYLFENQLKPIIFAAPELVLIGLNRILSHNASL